MRRLQTIIAAACALGGLTLTPWSPATAAPPETEVLEDYIVLFPDLNINRSVFLNITAVDFCAWEQSGFAGPPPAIDSIESTIISTGKGAVNRQINADGVYIELWEFDEDPSPLIGPCDDIQQQLDAGSGPWATGTATFRGKDNDLLGSGTRGNAFGERVTAQLTDQSGNSYRYSNVFRVNTKCNSPEFAPPACLVDNSQLRPA